MPVNDSTNVFNATENCAICTIAGIYDRTYQEFIKAFGKTDASFIGASRSTVADFFAKYSGQQVTLENQTTLQIKGIVKFLQATGMSNVKTIGSVESPLSGNTLMRTIYGYPAGTKFAILIGKSSGRSHFVLGAHWIACHRQSGIPAMLFVDYQLDTPINSRKLHRFGRVPQTAPLGTPYESKVPTRPWGEKVDTAMDHFVAISFTPPQ